MPQLYLTPRSVYELFQDRPLDMKMRERRGLLYGVYFQIGHAHMWTHTDPRKRATSIDLYQFGAAGAQTLGFHSAPEQWEWQRQGQWMLWCHQCPFMFQRSPCMVWFVKTKTHHHSSSRCLLYSPGDPEWFLLRFHIQNTVQRFRAHESSRFFLLYLPSSGNTMTEASLWSWIHSAAWCTQPKPALSSEMRRARNRVTNGMTHTEPWSQHPWVSVRLQ